MSDIVTAVRRIEHALRHAKPSTPVAVSESDLRVALDALYKLMEAESGSENQEG